MKNFLVFALLILALATSSATHGQITNPSPFVTLGQMLNISNTYANSSNDTVFGSTIYLTTTKRSTAGLPVAHPVIGDGTIAFTVSALKGATINPTVTVTPQRSFDGTNWATIPGVTVATLTPTSTTVAATTAYEYAYNYGNYYRMKITSSDTAGIKAWFNHTRNQQITLAK